MSDKHHISCDEFIKKLDDFIEGNTSVDDASNMKHHMENCSSCCDRFEAEENKAFLQGDTEEIVTDVKRIQSRFAWKITCMVVGIAALAVIVFFIMINIILPKIFQSSIYERSEELGYALTDLVEFTIPGAQIKGGHEGNSTLFNMLRLKQYEQVLVGGGLKTGKVEITTPLYMGKPTWNIEAVSTMEGNGYVFNYPQKKSGNSIEMHWDKLKKIGIGTKAQVALYFEYPVSPQEMKTILEEVQGDDRKTWLSIDTGDAVQWDYPGSKPYRELRMLNPQWGFPMHLPLTPVTASDVIRDEYERAVSMSSSVRNYDVVQVSELFKKEMKEFEKYSDKYFNAKEFTGDLKSINQYIHKNGIKIKGAIIEASTPDILKLRNNVNIVRLDIVKVDFDY